MENGEDCTVEFDLKRLSPGDVSAYRWVAMARFYAVHTVAADLTAYHMSEWKTGTGSVAMAIYYVNKRSRSLRAGFTG